MEQRTNLFVCPIPGCDYKGSEGWIHLKHNHAEQLQEAVDMLDKKAKEEKEEEEKEHTSSMAHGVELLELIGRFCDHHYYPKKKDCLDTVRRPFINCAIALKNRLPTPSREASLAMTHLETAFLWAQAALDRAGAAVFDVEVPPSDDYHKED